MSQLPRVRRRRGLRRPFRAYCEAIAIDDGRPLGRRLVDLSPRGALVAMDDEVKVGERVLLSFQMPWLGPIVHVRCVVERVVEGWRQDDPGYCGGLRFLDLSARDRLELARRLDPLPRTEGSRRHPTDYARAVWRIGQEPESVASLADRRARARARQAQRRAQRLAALRRGLDGEPSVE